MPEYGTTILLSLGMTGGPLCGDAAFTGIVALSIMAFGHLVVVLWLVSRRASPVCEFVQSGWNLFWLFVARAGFLLAVRIFFREADALCIFSNELLQIKQLRGVLI